MNEKVTVFVNTYDGYADCWDPFFALLSAYWPDCPQPVVLNTNHLSYSHPQIEVEAARGCADMPVDLELPWGDRCLRGLAKVTTPYVLYIVEDAFLNAPVRADVVEQLVERMDAESLRCVRIVEPDGAGPWRDSPWPGLWEVDQQAEYLVMTQAGLWHTESLRTLIDPKDNPWMFERRGGQRVRKRGWSIHCIDRDEFWQDEATRILPHDPATGIINGKWRREVVEDLFTEHGIDLDLEQRGFADEIGTKGPLRRVIDRVQGKLRTLR